MRNQPLVALLFLIASCYYIVVRPGATSSFLLLVAMPLFLVALLFLVVRPGAPSSVLAPSSDPRSP